MKKILPFHEELAPVKHMVAASVAEVVWTFSFLPRLFASLLILSRYFFLGRMPDSRPNRGH